MAAERTAIQIAAQETLQALLPGAMQGALATVQASLDQLMQSIQGIGLRMEAAESGLSKLSVGMDKITQEWAGRLDDIEGDLTTVQTEVRGSANDIEAEKRALMTKLNAEFANSQQTLTAIVVSARGEFDEVKSTIKDLHAKTANAFQQVKTKVEGLEAGGGGGNEGTTRGRWRGFIPAKQMVPSKYDNSEEK